MVSDAVVMIGVCPHGIYFGHSMPPTLPKSPQIEYIYKNIIKKYIFQNFTKKYIFQKNLGEKFL
jgi:hypothetical protein